MPHAQSACPRVRISASGEGGRTANAVCASRAGQRHGDSAFGKNLLGRLQRDRVEMRDIDDRSNSRHRERTLRDGVCATVLAAIVVATAAVVRNLTMVSRPVALHDRALVRAELQPQAVALRRGQHETDRQKGTRHE